MTAASPQLDIVDGVLVEPTEPNPPQPW